MRDYAKGHLAVHIGTKHHDIRPIRDQSYLQPTHVIPFTNTYPRTSFSPVLSLPSFLMSHLAIVAQLNPTSQSPFNESLD